MKRPPEKITKAEFGKRVATMTSVLQQEMVKYSKRSIFGMTRKLIIAKRTDVEIEYQIVSMLGVESKHCVWYDRRSQTAKCCDLP